GSCDGLRYSGINRDRVSAPDVFTVREDMAGDRRQLDHVRVGQQVSRDPAHATTLHAAVVIFGRRASWDVTHMLVVHHVVITLAMIDGARMVRSVLNARYRLESCALAPSSGTCDKREHDRQYHGAAKNATHLSM